MTKTKNKTLAFGLAAVLAAGVTGAAFAGLSKAVEANAELDTTATFESYPFAKGKDAFQYAPSFTMGTDDDARLENNKWLNKWEFVEVKFDKVANLQGATYVGVQLRVDRGSPGLTCGLLENGDRFYYDDNGAQYDKPVYYVSENGSVRESNIKYNANDPGRGFCGMLLIPMSSLIWQWNNNQSDLSNVASFYYTTNTMYNRNYKLTIGEIGYYDGEIGEAGTKFTKLVDLSKGERSNGMYYADSAHQGCMTFPSDSSRPELPYAFKEKDEAWTNTVTWTPTASDQTLTATFDAPADFSTATYLLVQYYSNGSTGLKFALSDGTNKRTLEANTRTFFIPQGTDVGSLKNVTDENGVLRIVGGKPQSVGNGKDVMGMIVIPLDGMYGTAGLSGITSLVITTTGAAKVLIGGIALNDGASKSVLELSENVLDKFAASQEGTLVKTEKPGRAMYGSSTHVTNDVCFDNLTIDEVFDAEAQKTANASEESKEAYYDNGGRFETQGSSGTIQTVETENGKKALRVVATGNIGDSYTAPEIGGRGFGWYGYKGVAFWAKNESNFEVSFNIEVNCAAPVVQKDGKTQWSSDRFNIPQGKRYYLYDENTGKTTIYMSRPTATLPVGFEGWVWIPFSAFARAEWSNNGVTVEQIYNNEYSVIERLGVSVKADQWGNMPFLINDFGAYKTTPRFESVYVNANGNTIDALLGL